VASYVPGPGQPRQTFSSSSNDPPEFDYFFDPNLGKFEDRPGAPCHTGQDNPTYLKIGLGADLLASGGIDDCSFASSTGGQAVPCHPSVVANLNAGQLSVINTDDYIDDINTCNEAPSLTKYMDHDERHWIEAVLVVDGQSYVRRLNFRRNSLVKRIVAEADTFVSGAAMASEFGNFSYATVRSSTTGDANFAFFRFDIPRTPLVDELVSARFQVRVMSRPISQLDLHLTHLTTWSEYAMNGANWFTQTGGSAGVIQSMTDIAAYSQPLFDVDDHVISDRKVSFGFSTTDTRSLRRMRTREVTIEGYRPVILVTYYRSR